MSKSADLDITCFMVPDDGLRMCATHDGRDGSPYVAAFFVKPGEPEPVDVVNNKAVFMREEQARELFNWLGIWLARGGA